MIYKNQYTDLNIKRYVMIIPAILLFINFCYATPQLLSGKDHRIPTSENISIEGIVRDEEGTLIKDATVSIKGTRNSTTTSEKGAFKLSEVAIGSTLTISHAGYEPYTVEITGSTTLDVIILQKRSGAN